MPRVGQRGQVEQHERQLERPPGGDLPAVFLDLGLRFRVSCAFLPLGGDRRVLALQEHCPVREAERRESLGVAMRGRVGHEVDARLDPLRALARGEDRGLGGRLERVRQGRHLRGLLIEPCRIAVRERSEHRRELGRRRVRQRFHGKLKVAERCPLAGRRRDGGGHLVAGQPGCLQPAGAPLTRADVRVYGDIAANGMLELVPVEQPQVTFLGVVVRVAA